MKIQLDTVAKTIKVEGQVNLKELYETLERLLPNEEWKQYSLETNTIIHWYNPITIPTWPIYPDWRWPWTYPTPIYTTGHTYTSDGNNFSSLSMDAINTTHSKNGVYNIEC